MNYKTIDVTKKDIENGIPEDCHACPIALAIEREFSYKNDPSIEIYVAGSRDIFVQGYRPDFITYFRVHPEDLKKVENFIGDFDYILNHSNHRKPLTEFSFRYTTSENGNANI